MIVAFTGIREADPGMADEIEMAVLDVIGAGATELRFGGALGADTMALEAACPHDVHRVVFVPFGVADQPKSARDVIRSCADDVLELDLPHSKSAYLKRNGIMIDGADRVVAFTDGRTTGGTADTIRKALVLDIPVTIVPVESSRRNPKIKGIDLSAELWALQTYVSATDGRHVLSDIIRRNKVGRASNAERTKIVRQLTTLISKTTRLAAADAIVAMPRRVPNAPSDMEAIAEHVAEMLGLALRRLVRTEEPTGGVVKVRRLRFSADEHARTLVYHGPIDETVIVLDNVVTTGASLEGAFRAVRAAKCRPLGLSVLYSTAFGSPDL